jgi:hypothetical protein
VIPEDMIAAISYQHPHISERIVQTWGDPSCVRYMTDLMIPSRYGRQGFNRAASGALMGLIELHDKLHSTERGDIWGVAA